MSEGRAYSAVEQSAGISRGRSGMMPHSAISIVDGRHVAVGRCTATATKQHALDSSRNGKHFLPRFHNDCRSMAGTMSFTSHQKDEIII